MRLSDFIVDEQTNSCICPAGQRMYSSGSCCKISGRVAHKFKGTKASCGSCELRTQCLRHPQEDLVLLTLDAKAKTDDITGSKLKEIRRALED